MPARPKSSPVISLILVLMDSCIPALGATVVALKFSIRYSDSGMYLVIVSLLLTKEARRLSKRSLFNSRSILSVSLFFATKSPVTKVVGRSGWPAAIAYALA